MATFSASSFRNAAPGLGILAQAIGGGGHGGAYEQARQGEIGFQSKIAQALASTRALNAKADQDNQETGVMAGRAGVADELLAAAAGTDVPTVAKWRQELTTGIKPMGSATGDAETDSAIGIAPQPQISSAIAKALAERAPEYAPYRTNVKDMKPDDLAQARAIDRTSRLSQAIIDGTANRNTVGGAQAAAAGKDLFKSGADGGVLDQFQGSLDTNNPMARSTINLRGAQANHQNAAAGASSALAEQRRAVTSAGRGGPGGKVPIGYRYTTGDDGEMKLEPIPGGPKDPNAQTGKPLPASASKGYLENQTNLLRAQRALALVKGEDFDGIQGDKNATGFMKGLLPNQMVNRLDPKGVDTRAALADLGSLVIHDRSGAAVTASEFPRLAPFIPTVYDDQATSQKKLEQFEKNYRAIVDDAAEFYRASGYNVPKMRERSTPAAAPASAGGFKYLGKE